VRVHAAARVFAGRRRPERDNTRDIAANYAAFQIEVKQVPK
jgi:hypothetical protein